MAAIVAGLVGRIARMVGGRRLEQITAGASFLLIFLALWWAGLSF